MIKILSAIGLVAALIVGFLMGMLQPRRGMLVCLFLLPYEGIKLATVGSFNSFLAIGYAMGVIVNAKPGSFSTLPYRPYLTMMTIWFAVSLTFSIITQSYLMHQDSLGLRLDSPVRAAVHHLVIIISAWLFYAAAWLQFRQRPLWRDYLMAFSSSAMYFFVTYIFSQTLKIDMPGLATLHRSDDITGQIFSGYTGSSGLTGEYTIIVISFCILLYTEYQCRFWLKLWALLVMGAATMMLIAVDSRSGILTGAFLVVSSVCIQWFRRKITALQLCLISFSIVCTLGIALSLFDYSYLTDRLVIGIGNLAAFGHGSGDVDVTMNRPILEEFPRLLRDCGLYGGGPFQSNMFRGSHLSSHNLLTGWLCKVGLVGLALNLAFIAFVVKDAAKAALHAKGEDRGMGIMLLVLIVVLLSNEMLHYYEQEAFSALMYWFVFALIAAVASRSRRQPGVQRVMRPAMLPNRPIILRRVSVISEE